MGVSVCEYLGQRAEFDTDQIVPKLMGAYEECPFRQGPCAKLKKKLPPICSVRKTDGTLWIVCEHRLCATPKTYLDRENNRCSADLNLHQKKQLQQIATKIYGEGIDYACVGVKREVPVPIEDGTTYKADYVMKLEGLERKTNEIILEMQGGGETSNTGSLTRHIAQWSQNPNRTNAELRTLIKNVNSIETNAWRRQQEQFLIKGNVATQTGAKIVFCVGELIYDYIHGRIERSNLRDLREFGWTLALIGITEDNNASTDSQIELCVDENRLLYTNYNTFVRTLTDQGAPCPEIFQGNFVPIN